MKYEYTKEQIMKMANIKATKFGTLKKKDIIPKADDTNRVPHVWYSTNEKLKEFLDSRKKK